MPFGYTKKQAERLKHKIDRQMAKIEDDVAAMGHIVSDASQNAYFGVMELEELREQAEQLKRLVDRRIVPDERTRTTRKRPSARCAICMGIQHIRVDGGFGKHHLWHGHDYMGVCPGTGLTPGDAENYVVEQIARQSHA